MKIRNLERLASRVLLGTALLVGAAACDNPVDSDGGHPTGLVVVNTFGQQVVASYDADAGAATGSVTAVVSGTQTYRLFLTDRNGGRITIDGSEFRVAVRTVVQPQLADASIQGTDQLVVTGKATGNTSVVFTVFHGGHEEFQATVPLMVLSVSGDTRAGTD